MTFPAIHEHRRQLASTVKPGTAFREAAVMSQLIAMIASACVGNMSLERAMLSEVGTIRHRGKGGGRPHHASKHYVAADKREARRARNRAR